MELDKLEVIDFILDEKRIERYSVAEKARIDTSFDFDVIESDKLTNEINALFRAKLKVEIFNKEKDDELAAKISLVVQIATFINNIEDVDFNNPSEEHKLIALNAFYPIARSLIADDMAFIKRHYNDLPYSLN